MFLATKRPISYPCWTRTGSTRRKRSSYSSLSITPMDSVSKTLGMVFWLRMIGSRCFAGLINISLLQGCTGIIFKSFEAHSFCRAIQDHKVSALRARIVLNGTCIVPDSCFDGALAGSKNKQKMLGCVLSEKNAKLSRYGAEVACSYNRMSVLWAFLYRELFKSLGRSGGTIVLWGSTIYIHFAPLVLI